KVYLLAIHGGTVDGWLCDYSGQGMHYLLCKNGRISEGNCELDGDGAITEGAMIEQKRGTAAREQSRRKPSPSGTGLGTWPDDPVPANLCFLCGNPKCDVCRDW